MSMSQKTRIVILGGGFGAVTSVDLERARLIQSTLVARNE